MLLDWTELELAQDFSVELDFTAALVVRAAEQVKFR
jgi:hypothetical protein